MSTVDEKIDRLILMVEHMDRKFEGKFDSLATEVHEFRYEMMRDYAELNHQVDKILEVFLCRKNA